MPPPHPADVTRILARVRAGEAEAERELLPLIYEELRGVARGQLARERRNHTLQATALLHEAWMKLGSLDAAVPQDRAHFMAIAARTMRQILVDHARGKKAEKRGSGWDKVTLDIAIDQLQQDELDLVALDETLQQLAQQDPRKARVVELRFFGGLSMNEIAEVLGVSVRTAEGDWYMARAWLRKALTD
ncbi:MAG: sigma-70 family RNA polymerase sigma factor [Planctomycetota bacterium]|nr:sigma-70 family RNA polymerase sigma factor [Planctomycetota bacterium]